MFTLNSIVLRIFPDLSFLFSFGYFVFTLNYGVDSTISFYDGLNFFAIGNILNIFIVFERVSVFENGYFNILFFKYSITI